MFKYFLYTLIFLFIFSNLGYKALLQTNTISLTIEIEGDVPSDPNGSIVVLDKGTYKVSSKSADSNQVGVITLNPSVTLRKSVNQNVYDVNTSGVSLVKASNKNGKISKGDYLTSSDIPGVAVKSFRQLVETIPSQRMVHI